jgi:hypothetical protein
MAAKSKRTFFKNYLMTTFFLLKTYCVTMQRIALNKKQNSRMHDAPGCASFIHRIGDSSRFRMLKPARQILSTGCIPFLLMIKPATFFHHRIKEKTKQPDAAGIRLFVALT